MSQAYCSLYLRLSWTLVPREGERELSSGSWVFIGDGEGGRGSRA